MRGRHQRLDRVPTADLERHDSSELAAGMFLHQRDRAGNGAAVGQPLLTDQRRTHVGYSGDPIVIQEFGGGHQLNAMTVLVEGPHVQETEIGAAAPAST
jgi:hypothetical protein